MNKGATLLRELDSSLAILIEEKGLTYEALEKNIGFFIHIIDGIDDYREKSLIEYPLSSLILLSLILIMKGEFRSFYYAANYIKVYKEEFEKMGLIIDGKTPSHDTLRRMFMLLDSKSVKENLIDKLDRMLTRIVDNYGDATKKELISFDGKEFNGSGRGEKSSMPRRNKNVLNVYSTTKELCLHSNPIDDKESEIKEAQEIIPLLRLKNTIVTADALHCQKNTCKLIRKKQGDYIITVKENQSSLHEEIKSRINAGRSLYEIELNDCKYTIFHLPKGYAGMEFPGQKSYVRMISNKRTKQPGGIVSTRFFITSLSNDRLIAEAIDNRWKIENDLHKIKDELFSEDDYRFMDKNAIKVMAMMNNIAYSFFRIVSAFLQEKIPEIVKIRFKKDPIEVLSKIGPLLSSKDFGSRIEANMKGRKSR